MEVRIGWQFTLKNVKCSNDYSVHSDKSLCEHCTNERTEKSQKAG